MKTLKLAIIGAVALSFATAIHSFAMDGLQIVAQSGNAVLFWPSLTNETYVVQYRQTLAETDSWATLANYLQAANDTNVTFFTDPNGINYPTGASGGTSSGGGGIPLPSSLSGAFGGGNSIEELMPPPPPPPHSGSGISGALSPSPLYGSSDETPGTGFYRVLGVRVENGLTNGVTASGLLNVQTRLEPGAKYLRLIANGQTYPMQDLLLPPFTDTNSVTFSYVDTARLANSGPYTLQVEGVWQDPNASLRDDGLLKAYSQPFAVYTTNELSYPDWDDYVNDDSDSFYVQSAHAAVDWEIDIYNYYDYLNWYYGYTNSIYPIHIATGSTTNGLIEYHWDLMDDYGTYRTNEDVDPYFISFTYTTWQGNGGLSGAGVQANGVQPNTGGGGAATGNPLQKQSAPWPADGGYWVVAYQDMFRHYYDDGNLMHAMLNGWLSMAGNVNPVFYQTPIGGTNAQTYPMRYQYPQGHRLFDTNFSYQGQIYDDNLLHLMIHDSRARNFYYFGHGNSEWIGNALYAALERQYGTHRYRFVWLDGCETANGDWDKVFNINGPGRFSLDYYKQRSKRPAVFMGHGQTIPLGIFGQRVVNGTTYDGTIPDSVPYFRSNFVFIWQLENYKLNDAIQYAVDNTPDENMHYEDGPLDGQHYAPGDALQIEGYDELKWNEYNGYGEIPRP